MQFAAKTVHAPSIDMEFDILADDSVIGPTI